MRSRLGNIDGLRGLAASLVLLQHLFEQVDWLAPPRTRWAHWPAQLFLQYLDLGKIGVVAFFAVSGFVVPFSFGRGRGKAGFIIGRIFRLYPAYWLSLLAAIALLPLVSDTKFTAMEILANVTMLQQAFHSPDILPVYWTLFVELLFYSLCVVMFRLGWLDSSRAIFGVFAAFLAAAMIGSILRARLGFALPVAIPLYICVMLFGTEARHHFVERDGGDGLLLRVMLALLIVTIPAAWLIAYTDASHRETVNADILGFFIAIALFLLCVMRNAFAGGFLMYVGAISYSIYLFHPIALDLARYAVSSHGWPINGVVFVSITVVSTFSVAKACLVFVEKPMIGIGHRIARYRSTGAA